MNPTDRAIGEREGVGGPPCSREDMLCENRGCRYYIDWFELGNCTLRTDREHTFTEIGMAFGLSRQRAEQICQQAIRRYRQKYTKIYAGAGWHRRRST